MFQMVINNKRVLFVQGLGESELPGVLDFVKSQPDNSSKQVAFIGVPATSISAKVVEALSEGFKVHFVDNHGIFGTLPPNVSLDDLRESTIRIKVRLEQRALIAGGSRKRCYAGLI